MERIRIKLKAYDYRLLDQSVEDIMANIVRTGAEVSGPIPLPTKKKVYTVLRSPHVNKRSREQFISSVHKRVLELTQPTAKTVDALRKLNLPVGVEVEITQKVGG